MDRHGDDSINNPTDVPHFKHKHQIEEHLISRTRGTAMSWTILRPVAFMENITNDFFGRVFNTAWRDTLKGKKLQLVAVKDVGFFAARAFTNPELSRGQAISLAGEEMTLDEYAATFKRTTGQDIVFANGWITAIIMWLVKDLGYMFKWFHDVGYAADIEALRKIYPDLQGIETWLKTESVFRKTS